MANTKSYLQQMTGNSYFPSPVPTLAAVEAQLAKLEAAYTTSQTRQKGTVADMHAELKTLCLQLKMLAMYVEDTANANPEMAVGIMASSGMPARKTLEVPPKLFTVKLTGIPGEVRLNNKAVPGASYIYAMTTDPKTSATWVNIIFSREVKNVYGGLVSGTRYYFRTAIVQKSVQGPWSEVINMIIP